MFSKTFKIIICEYVLNENHDNKNFLNNELEKPLRESLPKCLKIELEKLIIWETALVLVYVISNSKGREFESLSPRENWVIKRS